MAEKTYHTAVREALIEEMERDERVVLFGEDVHDPFGGVYKISQGFQARFGPSRVRPTPISEATIIGLGTGAAMTGLRPVAEIMLADFLGIALDQLGNHAAKLRYMTGGAARIPLTVRTVTGIGRGFGAQHSQSVEAWLVHIPGLKVVMPSTAADAKGLLKSAIRDDNPVVVFENSRLYPETGEVPEGEHLVPLGQADVKREGTDVTVVAIQRLVPEALRAADMLAKEGISVEVVDPRTVVPLDEETILRSVAKTHRLVIAHDAVERGGVGAEIAALVQAKAFDELDAPIERVAGPPTPIPFAKSLEDSYVRNAEHVAAAIRQVLGICG